MEYTKDLFEKLRRNVSVATLGLECGRAADLAVFDANLNLKAVFMDGERML